MEGVMGTPNLELIYQKDGRPRTCWGGGSPCEAPLTLWGLRELGVVRLNCRLAGWCGAEPPTHLVTEWGERTQFRQLQALETQFKPLTNTGTPCSALRILFFVYLSLFL